AATSDQPSLGRVGFGGLAHAGYLVDALHAVGAENVRQGHGTEKHASVLATHDRKHRMVGCTHAREGKAEWVISVYVPHAVVCGLAGVDQLAYRCGSVPVLHRGNEVGFLFNATETTGIDD